MRGQKNTFSFPSSNWNKEVLVGCRKTAGNTLVLGSTWKPKQMERFVQNDNVTDGEVTVRPNHRHTLIPAEEESSGTGPSALLRNS